MSREKQSEQLKNDITECYGCDPLYYGTDGDFLAKELVEMGWRKQSEGEWLLIKVPTGVELYGIREVQTYPKCSLCDYMGDVSEWHFKYCPNCGANMKGGA